MLGGGWLLPILQKSESLPQWLTPPLVFGCVPMECIIWSLLILHLAWVDFFDLLQGEADQSSA